MPEASDFYVYALLREDGVTPFYIGKGQGNRVSSHTYPSALARKNHKNFVIRKVVAALGYLPHEKIETGLTEAEAFEAEAGLITLLGRQSDGYLTNATDGGEGASGQVATPEARANRAAAQRGKKASPEARAKMAAAKRGKTRPPEAREAIRRGMKAARTTEHYSENGRRAAEIRWAAR